MLKTRTSKGGLLNIQYLHMSLVDYLLLTNLKKWIMYEGGIIPFFMLQSSVLIDLTHDIFVNPLVNFISIKFSTWNSSSSRKTDYFSSEGKDPISQEWWQVILHDGKGQALVTINLSPFCSSIWLIYAYVAQYFKSFYGA